MVGTDVPFTGRSVGMRGVAVDTVFDGRAVSVHAPLRGGFQVANIATAVAICDALRATGIAIDAAARRPRLRERALAGTDGLDRRRAADCSSTAPTTRPAWPRWSTSARELIGGRRCVAVFAAMRNKDVESMAAGLRELTREIVVTAPAVERATPPADLARLFEPPAEVAADVTVALDRARQLAGRDGVVVVCGSLYLAGEVLELLGV